VSANESGETIEWLERLEAGDPAALDRLIPLLYDELRVLARRNLRAERFRYTLGTTALVNEAYLRLAGQRELRPESRAHFFGIAGRTMRRVLVDYARMRTRQKRGGDADPRPLEEAMEVLSAEEADEILALDAALDRLSEANARAAAVVQYRFFAGLTLEETAEVLHASTRTVQREWSAARAWLLKEISRELDLGPAETA
jgi:RNA polymerase sigma factor (TIGR02999 family)